MFIPKEGGSEISEMQIAMNNKSLNVLRWRASGEPDYYDHFVLLADIGYGLYVIGTVAPQAAGKYSFTDHKFSDRPGTVEYFVVPVYHSHDKGTRIKIGDVSIKHPSYDLEYWSGADALSNIPPPGIV